MKTKLGVSVGLFGAAVYFLGLFGGLLSLVIVAGYILLFEENEWLKFTAIKAIGISVLFSIAVAVVGFVPNLISFTQYLVGIFGGSFSVGILNNVVGLINTVLAIAEKVIFLLFGFGALKGQSKGFGIIDRLLSKHFTVNAGQEGVQQ